MKHVFNLLNFFLLVGLYSCEIDFYASNYYFETHAEYYAPQSHLKALIDANGYVPKGEDLGDQKAAVINTKIAIDNRSDTIFVESSGQEVFRVFINRQLQHFSDAGNYSTIIMNCLKELDINTYSKDEIDELALAILCTGYGPKGHFLEGQTKLIQVDTVFYTTRDK